MKLPSPEECKAFFPGLRRCVVKILLLLVAAILEHRSCCLYRCAESIPGKAHFESKYRRLMRLVASKSHKLLQDGVARLILCFVLEADKVELVIDRTNWKLGRKPVNVLFVGVLVDEDIYIPLLWEALPKHGSSSQKERVALMKRLEQLWPDPQTKFTLVGDREFVGKTWIKWLHERDFDLVIRLRREDYFSDLALSMPGADRMKRIKKAVRKNGYFCSPITINGCSLFFIALPDKKSEDETIFLLSSRDDIQWTSETYRRRWSIEVCFKHMKSNGFDLEATHLTEPERLHVLISAVSLAYVIAISEGVIARREKPIKQKKSRGKTWAAVSLFRYGLRSLSSKAPSMAKIMGRIRRFLRKIRPKLGPPELGLQKSVG